MKVNIVLDVGETLSKLTLWSADGDLLDRYRPSWRERTEQLEQAA